MSDISVMTTRFPGLGKELYVVEKDWLNVKEASEYLQVSRETIYSLMERGLLPYSEVQGVRGRRIRREDLDALLNENEGNADSEKTKKKK